MPALEAVEVLTWGNVGRRWPIPYRVVAAALARLVEDGSASPAVGSAEGLESVRIRLWRFKLVI